MRYVPSLLHTYTLYLSSFKSKVMRQIDHTNIIKYYDSFISNMSLVIVMEYAQGGDLAQKIRAQNKYEESNITNFIHLWV